LANHPFSPAELPLKPERILLQNVLDIAFRDFRSLRLQNLSGELELAVGVVDEEACDVLGVYKLDEDLPHEATAVLEVGEYFFGLCEGVESLRCYVVDYTGGFFTGCIIGLSALLSLSHFKYSIDGT